MIMQTFSRTAETQSKGGNVSETRTGIMSPLIIGAGIALAGWFAGHGFVAARLTDRYVTVKGISEREVKADLALWPIRLVTSDDDLGKAKAKMSENVRRVREFLTRAHLDGAGAELQKLEVRDAYANQYGDATKVRFRYVIQQTLMVRSDHPEAVAAASQMAGELVASGIVLTSEEGEAGSGGPRFVFTKLNDLKPKMIEETTSRARESASKFAQDSGSKLGGIRQASQGLFEILPRDQVLGAQESQANNQEGSQVNKIVRVVSTVEYFLKD